jgi:hypothetical protein
MVNYARVQHHIDRGKGIAARKLGPPFLAYRCGAMASGDFPDGWVATPGPQGGLSFSLFRRRMPDTKLELGLSRAAIFFDIIANMEPFLVGDVFVQNDPPYVPGVSYGAGATSLAQGTMQLNAMCFAWHPPVGKAVGVRLDRCGGIYRPATAPLTFTDASNYWASTHDNDQPLVLAGGNYSFPTGHAGEPASLVPVGFTADHRNSDRIFGPSVPGMVTPLRWLIYIPPLPGYSPREGDAVITEDGARFVMRSPFTQETGVVGTMTLCERKIAQATT